MNISRLRTLLRGIRGKRILVIGDFFLDKYLVIDPALEETSLETRRRAHQVVSVRTSPGGAGTVTSNLAALEVQPFALGLKGDDGEGWELTRVLQATGVNVDGLLSVKGHTTGTYVKPMLRSRRGEEETERLDLRRRHPLHPGTIQAIIKTFRNLIGYMDGVIGVDAVPEDFGVIGDKVRREIARLGRTVLMVVDSRRRTGLFRNVIVKPNLREAAGAIGRSEPTRLSKRWVESTARALSSKTGRPVFITAEAEGIFVFDERQLTHAPALPPRGSIDTVGAGDCVAAAICASLCAGATLTEAAEIANLAASVVIHKLRTTGTASAAEILKVFSR